MSGTVERDRIERQARNVSPPLRRPVDRVRVACLAAVAARTLPLQSWTASFVLPCPFLPSFLDLPRAKQTKRGGCFFSCGRERERERGRSRSPDGIRYLSSPVVGGSRTGFNTAGTRGERVLPPPPPAGYVLLADGDGTECCGALNRARSVSGRNCYCRTKGRMNERRSR